MTPEGAALLKECEGLRLTAYLDGGGVPTIGYGHTKGVQMGDRCTLEQAEKWFDSETAEFQKSVFQCCVPPYPTDHQFDAMTILAYNIGIRAFAGSTVLREHNHGNFHAAADAFRMWNKDNGKVIPGLVNRREKERALYLHV